MRGVTMLLAFVLLPTLLLAACYHAWLGHRSDYLGHYLAGAGGTLGLAVVLLATLFIAQRESLSAWALLLVCLVSIGLGAIAEATIYRIAKFDEVDFCNQSLGAVLVVAGLLAVAARGELRFSTFAVGLIASVALLAGGYHFAFQ